MSKKTRIFAGLLSLAIAMGSFAGCGDGGTTSPATDAPVESSTTSTPADEADYLGSDSENKTISINAQASPGHDAAWKAVAEGYMKLHPEVTITVDLKPEEGYAEWVQNIFTTETPSADIVNINEAGAVSVGKAVNYMEYADLESGYSDGVWTEQFNYDMQVRDLARGEWTALSLDSVQVLWLYNKNIFDEVGVTPPTTWNELVAACEKIEAAGYQAISLPGDFDSFWSGKMGWLAQIYADQTTRSLMNTFRAQEGDYCYDPDIDGVWAYDPTDPYNDDSWLVNTNPLRAYKAIVDGVYAADSVGMKTVWTNFAQVFPKYAGGDAFFGTKDAIPMFYQGKAAMLVDGAWGLMQFDTNMAKLASGEEIVVGEDAVEGVQKFELGTFNMPSMEGEGIEANARTIEVANGFLGAIKKDKPHDDLVVDFMMYFSSKDGQTEFLTAAIANEANISGPSLVYGVELPAEIQSMFDNLSFIGNCQKGRGQMLARGMGGTTGDIQESYRAFYDYSYSYLSGKTTVDEWLAAHKGNITTYLDESMTVSSIVPSDLENPQNEPTGQ